MSALFPDLERYRDHAVALGLADAQMDDAIHSIYRIMQSFVDAAFGDHPVQQCLPQTTENPSGTQQEHAKISPDPNTQDSETDAAPNGGREWSP